MKCIESVLNRWTCAKIMFLDRHLKSWWYGCIDISIIGFSISRIYCDNMIPSSTDTCGLKGKWCMFELQWSKKWCSIEPLEFSIWYHIGHGIFCMIQHSDNTLRELIKEINPYWRYCFTLWRMYAIIMVHYYLVNCESMVLLISTSTTHESISWNKAGTGRQIIELSHDFHR